MKQIGSAISCETKPARVMFFRLPGIAEFLIITAAVLFTGQSLPAREITAAEIISGLEEATRGDSSMARFSIRIERARFTSTLRIESWDERKTDRAFMRVLEPKKDYGTTFLKIKSNLWQYIPKIGREIKLEGSMLSDSWMGSDFTNDDLVKSVSLTNDFTHLLLPSDNKNLWKLELKPKPGTPTQWPRTVLQIRKSDFLPAYDEFYDHRNELKRTIEYSEYTVMGGKTVPAVMTVTSLEQGKPKSRTILRYEKAIFNQPIPESVFTKANLRR